MIRTRARRRPPAPLIPSRIEVRLCHEHVGLDAERVYAGLAKILHRVGVLEAQGVRIVADINEVNQNMETLATNLAELAREIGVLTSGGPALVTQEQLDALNEKVKGLAALAAGADPNP